MKKQNKVLIKIQRLLRQLNCREYLHHFGPKKFKLREHFFALLMKEVLRCSFRRCSKIIEIFGMKTPTYSALCKSRKRIPNYLWSLILKLTGNVSSEKIAIDATGFSRTNPSFHFVKRIDRKNPIKSYAKVSAMFDLPTRKFVALKVRVKPRHEIKDVKYLLKQFSSSGKLFGDSAYDAEWLHEYCFEKDIQTIIKPRKNVRKGFYRRKQMKNYSEEEYHQRSLIESGFSAMKRKYGGNVSGKSLASINSEIYLKAIACNLELKH